MSHSRSEFEIDRNGDTILHRELRELDPDIYLIQSLLKRYPTIAKVANNKGGLPLHTAAKFGDLKIVDWILRAFPDGALVVSRDQHNTPLHIAAQRGRVEIVRCLTSFSTDAAFIPSLNGLPLHVAIRHSHDVIVDELMRIAPNCASAIIQGGTAAHYATTNNKLESLKCMIQRDRNLLNLADEKGCLCHHLAAINGLLPCLKVLMDQCQGQKDIELYLSSEESHGCTPLYMGCCAGSLEVVHYLINLYPAALYIPANKGTLPIHVSSLLQFLPIVQEIVKYDPLCCKRTRLDSSTALHLVFRPSDQGQGEDNQQPAVLCDLVSTLLRAYPQAAAVVNSADVTPLALARQQLHRVPHVIRLLLRAVPAQDPVAWRESNWASRRWALLASLHRGAQDTFDSTVASTSFQTRMNNFMDMDESSRSGQSLCQDLSPNIFWLLRQNNYDSWTCVIQYL